MHEFSTIPGVVEDVTEIILNLKEVKVKLDGDGPKKITIEVKGDRKREANETFFVRLSVAVNALLADNEGVGTIVNDD